MKFFAEPLGSEDRAEIERILPKAKQASDGDGDWAECYDKDVRLLLAAEKYWREKSTELRKAIEAAPHPATCDIHYTVARICSCWISRILNHA